LVDGGDSNRRRVSRAKLVRPVSVTVTAVLAALSGCTQQLLRKYGYPPDKQEQAVTTVLQQAELFADQWAA
jgi:type I restriction enzyme R subunit